MNGDDDDFLFLDGEDDIQPQNVVPGNVKTDGATVVPPFGKTEDQGVSQKRIDPRKVVISGGMRPNKPNVNVGQEEILVQGPTYKSEEGNTTPEKDTPDISREREITRRVSRISPKILFSVSVVLVVFVLVCVLVYTMNKNEVRKQEAEEESRLAEIMNEETTESVFKYSRDEVEELRLAGYTGYEIEEFELNRESADIKVKEAEEARKKKYDEEILPYFDEASDAYKSLVNSTWLSQESFEVDSDVSTYQNGTTVFNLDYEKAGCYGKQCWLKVYLNEESTFFIFVTPKRYTELKNSGNIVLSLEFTNIGDTQRSVITGWSEIQN